jgi:hypothetical protein
LKSMIFYMNDDVEKVTFVNGIIDGQDAIAYR